MCNQHTEVLNGRRDLVDEWNGAEGEVHQPGEVGTTRRDGARCICEGVEGATYCGDAYFYRCKRGTEVRRRGGEHSGEEAVVEEHGYSGYEEVAKSCGSRFYMT